MRHAIQLRSLIPFYLSALSLELTIPSILFPFSFILAPLTFTVLHIHQGIDDFDCGDGIGHIMNPHDVGAV